MEDKIIIEKMDSNDLDIVYQMNLDIFKDDPWPIDWFKEGLNNLEGYYYKAFYKGKLAGYCGMYNINYKVPNYCKIATLGVKEEYRQNGIGKAMMQKMLDTAKQLRLEKIKLEVNTKNPALKMYENFGFKIVEFKENYYEISKEDAYIMWRE